MLICKFASVKTKVAEKLTAKEKAKYALETQNKKIDEKIKDYYSKIQKCLTQIKENLVIGNKQSAALILRRKK